MERGWASALGLAQSLSLGSRRGNPSTELMSLGNQQPSPGSVFSHLTFLIWKTVTTMPTWSAGIKEDHDNADMIQFAILPFLLYLWVL